MPTTTQESRQFQNMIKRNTFLPLIMMIVLSGVFIGIILHLMASAQWVSHTNQVIARAYRGLQLAVDAETGVRGFVITNNPEFLEPYRRASEVALPTLDQLAESVRDNPSQVARIQSIQSKLREWFAYSDQLLHETTTSQSRRQRIASEAGKKIMDSIREDFETFTTEEAELRDQRASNTQDTVRYTLGVIAIAGLICGFIIAVFTRRQLQSLNATFTEALKKQSEYNAFLEKQNWLQAGQNGLGDHIRGDLPSSELCNKTLHFLCNYLDARAGALYTVEDDETLKLASQYGLSDQEAQLHSRLSSGSTLIGQAARELKPIALDRLPAQHIKINTGLGVSEPISILIAPAVTNQRAKAVLELAFLKPLTERETELMTRISEDIAISLTSAQYRAQLHDLLEESQRQAEELQSQQEELRTSNEELEEQAQALKDSQSRMELQQAELERQNDALLAARESIEQKARELERASQYKSQFLANMSHELRTPLNSTLILSQLLIDNKGNRLSREETEYARTILNSSNDLLALINDILDLAKIESGTVDLHSEPLEIDDLLERLSSAFKPMAEQKKVAFKIERVEHAPKQIVTDRKRLEQILKNLASNAVKFTARGEIKIRFAAISDSEVEFQVSDTGIGIPQNQHDLIFEAFRQADETTSRHFGGTGLGLTISRDLAHRLSGSLTLESELGKGSVFKLRLPRDLGAPAPYYRKPTITPRATDLERNKNRPTETAPRVQLQEGMRILLIIEDDASFALALSHLGHEQNFQTLIARTAEEAIDLAIAHRPHAIILDMQLPDHSGLFVLDRLKEDSTTRHIPVHVVSAHDYSDAALQMGAIGYLNKPAHRDQLVEVIQKLQLKLSQNFKSVLIIEDNAVQRENLKSLIAAPGVEAVTAETGQQALEKLRATSFDCIVLDLALPDMSGYEVLESMSAQGSKSFPPVIIYTARDLTKIEEERLQRYSRSIILKGAKSPERLLNELSLFLHQIESDLPVERQKALRELRDRERTLEGRTILLVDDDVRNVFALNSALTARGAKTEIARTGKEAIDRLTTTRHVDLVLMDIMMPEMDGFEATRLIRKDPSQQNIPIIALTAKAMSDDQEKCLEAGASDYLAKPIDLPKLLSLIKIWLPPAKGIV